MSILVDTNLLLRRVEPGHPDHPTAIDCVARLRRAGEALCVTPQNIAEFWNVATRPITSNGLGFDVAAVEGEASRLERLFLLLPEVPAIFEAWKALVLEHRVRGAKVFDARLVATMRVHGVERILTFNTADFVRFGVEVLHPAEP